MVKKDAKRVMPESARRIAAAIKGLMAERGITQMRVADALGGRSQSYVSERVNGVDAWNTLELDQLAELLRFEDTFTLLAEVARRAQS